MTAVTARTDASGTVTTLRLGTRRSALATAQSRMVAAGIESAAALTGQPVRVELVEVTTPGDVSMAPLSSFGGVGVFVSALREALLDGRVDLAVHSLKDLPTAPFPGLELAAVPAREAFNDVLVTADGRGLAGLAADARVGTGSPRRAAQLRAASPGLTIVDIRGNVDTRLRMVAAGELDAIVLALAGLRRLGRDAEVSQVLPASVMLPAPGQGALGIECRADDAAVLAALAPLEHPHTRAAVTAERALLARLEAGCAAPLGALAEVTGAASGADGNGADGNGADGNGADGNGADGNGADGDGAEALLTLQSVVADPEAVTVLRRVATGPVDRPEDLGRLLADHLLADGADRLVAAASPFLAPDGPWRSGGPRQTDPGPAASESRSRTSAGEGDL